MVEEVIGDSKVTAVRVQDVVTGETEDLAAAGVFVAIGHAPNTAVFAGQLELDENSYIRTKTVRPGNVDERRGGLRLRRRPGPLLPASGHCGRLGLHGRDRC